MDALQFSVNTTYGGRANLRPPLGELRRFDHDRGRVRFRAALRSFGESGPVIICSSFRALKPGLTVMHSVPWFEHYVEVESDSDDLLALARTMTQVVTEKMNSKPVSEVSLPAIPASEVRARLQAFELVRRLGSGGQGEVWLANDPTTGHEVALKLLHRHDLPSLRAIKEEFRALASLRHPNLIRLYELGADQDCAFFSMEYLAGCSPLEYLRVQHRQPLPPNLMVPLRFVVTQIAVAIEASHQAGLLHRDIKPDNILVTDEGRAVLLDFGLLYRARRRHAVTPRICGTPVFMAPELLRGDDPSVASDWFAFGTMLYQLLTGYFPSESIEGIDFTAEYTPLRDRCPHVPEDLEELCTGLLQRDPSRRPDGREVLARLGASGSNTSQKIAWVGRHKELGSLHKARAQAQSGETICVEIVGPSGIGKSTLVERFLAGVSDAAVFSGRCFEGALVPFQTLDEVVDGIALHSLTRMSVNATIPAIQRSVLTHIFPALREALKPEDLIDPTATDLRQHSAEGFRNLVAAQSQGGGVVLWFDDIQWSDSDSSALILHLFRRPLPGLLILLTRRDDGGNNPVSSALSTLGSGTYRELVLGPLSAQETASLLEQSALPASKRALHSQTRGHPLLLNQLLRQQRLVWHLERDPDTVNIPLTQFDVGVLVHLAPAHRHVLEWLALGNQPLAPEFLGQIVGDNLGTIVSDLKGFSMVRAQATGDLRCGHDHLRETILACLAPWQRLDRHRTIAACYERLAADNDEALAFHHEAGGSHTKAAHYLTRTARHAWDQFAFERAAQLLGRAIEHLGKSQPAVVRGLRRQRAQALARAGALVEAANLYATCANESDGGPRQDALRLGAEARLTAGDYTGALPALRELLVRVGLPPLVTGRSVVGRLVREVVSLLRNNLTVSLRTREEVSLPEWQRLQACLSAVRGFNTYDTLRGAAYSFLYLREALKVGEREHVSLAASYASTALAFTGTSLTDALRGRVFDAGSLAALATGDDGLRGILDLADGAHHLFHGRWAQAYQTMASALLPLTQRGEYGAERDIIEQLALIALERMGNFQQLHERASELHRTGELLKLGAAVCRNAMWLALVALANDQPAEALRHCDVAAALIPDHAYLFQHWMLFNTRVQCALYEERINDAATLVAEGWPKLRRSGLMPLKFIRIPAQTLFALTKLRDRPTPRTMRKVRRIARRMIRDDALHAQGDGHLVLAAWATTNGRSDVATAALHQATQLFRAADMHLHELAARRLLASHTGQPVADIDTALTAAGVTCPERWIQTRGLPDKR